MCEVYPIDSTSQAFAAQSLMKPNKKLHPPPKHTTISGQSPEGLAMGVPLAEVDLKVLASSAVNPDRTCLMETLPALGAFGTVYQGARV